MRTMFLFLLALAVFTVVHESTHALASLSFGEYRAFHVRPYGLEVEFKTPIPDRVGIKWAIISGASNILTCSLGYLLLMRRRQLCHTASRTLRGLTFWVALLGLVADPLNLSIGPFLYGGDASGIAVGLETNCLIVQIFSFVIFLLNRELVVQKLLPTYGIQTRHPLFRRWF